MENKELICIGCPMGCAMTACMDGGEVVSVSGNTCIRGERYARKELTDPTRIVTSSVRVRGGKIPMVSVKTGEDIPKNKIFDCMEMIKTVIVDAPIYEGTVLVHDIAGTGADLIATKSVEKD